MLQTWLTFTGLFMLVTSTVIAEDGENAGADRVAKLLPVFQVVRFPNDPCVVTGGSKNGTCYTAEECSNKGGTNGGSCAEGFGVCCQFTLGCGSSSSENCTYFVLSSTEAVAGACSALVCKASSDICQLRLDLDTFVITGPATTTTSISGTIGGVASIFAATDPVNSVGRCLTDTFTVSNQVNLPVICGIMTGEHVYVDAADNCNSLDFQFGYAAELISTIATRSINIKVSQISCFDANRAPQGCDQWYYGNSGIGQIMSFNKASSSTTYHLANQRQTVCIRREKSYCRLCFTGAAADVQISGTGIKAYTKSESCCGAGSKGTLTFGADCLIIPGASKAADSAFAQISQCGGGEGVASHVPTINTVCTKVMPFKIDFMSDSFEFSAIETGVAKGSQGFVLTYFQTAC